MIWICGAPGAGKSVAAWALTGVLAAEGRAVAYVDIDQLGMLHPEADDDPDRHRLKAEALRALVPGYLEAGAQTLVVSGVVDAGSGPRATLGRDVDLTLCLLSPDPTVLYERILARGWGASDAGDAVAEDEALRTAPFVDVRIPTEGLSVADTAVRLAVLAQDDGPSPPVERGQVASPADIPVTVVTGARAVGASTVGFGLAARHWRAGRRVGVGFLDLQQLGFLARPRSQIAPEVAPAVRQLAAMHDLMARHGASRLVVSGHLSVPDRATLRAALPAAPVTVVRLRADAPTLEAHVRSRGARSDARLAGDDLLGADASHQQRVVAAAVAEQAALDAADDDDVVVDVSGRSPEETIDDVETAQTGISAQ